MRSSAVQRVRRKVAGHEAARRVEFDSHIAAGDRRRLGRVLVAAVGSVARTMDPAALRGERAGHQGLVMAPVAVLGSQAARTASRGGAQTTIECAVDVTTTDGYKLRLFCIAFTKRRQNQLKKTTYAQTAQIKQIRKKMTDIMTKEASCVPCPQTPPARARAPCSPYCAVLCCGCRLNGGGVCSNVDLKDLVKKFIPNSIGTQIEQVPPPPPRRL